tara:strand:- start:23 stop:358 length:336 start_codon:yes stop_codon:yes gene_type:complete
MYLQNAFTTMSDTKLPSSKVPSRRSKRKRRAPLTYLEEFEAENIKKMFMEDVPKCDVAFALSEALELDDKEVDDAYDPLQDKELDERSEASADEAWYSDATNDEVISSIQE